MQSNQIAATAQQVFAGYSVIGGSILMYLAHLIEVLSDKGASTLV